MRFDASRTSVGFFYLCNRYRCLVRNGLHNFRTLFRPVFHILVLDTFYYYRSIIPSEHSTMTKYV